MKWAIRQMIYRLANVEFRTRAQATALAAAIVSLIKVEKMLRANVLLIIAAVVLLSGCHSLDKLLGTEDHKKEHKAGFYIVAACMDNNETGHPTFPPFLPESHVDLIKRVKAADDGQINGDTWLAVGVSCGQGHGYIGDEYYVGRGY